MAIKCPFCHTNNEDGALFCDLCKSDLSSVAPPLPPPAPCLSPPEAVPMAAEAMPMAAEPMPMAAEAIPIANEPMPALPAEPMPAVAEAIPPPAAGPPPNRRRLHRSRLLLPAPAPLRRPHLLLPPAAAAAAGGPLPAGSQPKLVVQRGQKRNVEYPIYEGLNFIGRADEKPVDIDLEDQEPPDRVWCSRQHACIKFEGDILTLEDLNSANGTYLNRGRVYPGQPQPLKPGDVIQIGNVQLKVAV